MVSVLGNTRKGDLVFSASGRIEISSRVSRLLSLHRGDVIDILSDDLGDLYLCVRHRNPVIGRYEASVFPTNRSGRHFRTFSIRLATAVLKACGEGLRRVRICVGAPVVNPYLGTMLPIITKLLL